MAGYCVHGNRIWGSTKRGIFLEQSKTHQLSKKDCVLWRQLTPYFCFYIYIYIYIYTHTHTHVTFTIVRKVIGGIYIYIYIYIYMGRVAQSVQRLTTGWRVRDQIPLGTRFFTRPDRLWGQPSILQNGYRVFPGGKVRPSRAAVVEQQSYTSTHPLGHSGPVTESLYLYIYIYIYYIYNL